MPINLHETDWSIDRESSQWSLLIFGCFVSRHEAVVGRWHLWKTPFPVETIKYSTSTLELLTNRHSSTLTVQGTTVGARFWYKASLGLSSSYCLKAQWNWLQIPSNQPSARGVWNLALTKVLRVIIDVNILLEFVEVYTYLTQKSTT